MTLATAGFFLVYRIIEDYFLVLRIIGRAVEVPALVTVLALLIGGALLGLISVLVAIPVAAAVLPIVREVLIPVSTKADRGPVGRLAGSLPSTRCAAPLRRSSPDIAVQDRHDSPCAPVP